MNKIYRVIWSKTKNCYVVASELAKRHTKAPQSGIVNKIATLALVGAMSFGFAGSAWAAIPEGTTHGSGAIAIGTGSKADGNYSIAVGDVSVANGVYSLAVGAGAETGFYDNADSENIIDVKASHAAAVGPHASAQAMYSSVFGAYSGVTVNPEITIDLTDNKKDRVLQGFGATVLGSLNSSSTSATNNGQKYASVANSIVGVANIATDSNGALIYGAGNAVTNSYQDVIFDGDDEDIQELVDLYDQAVNNGDRTKMAQVAAKLRGMVKVSGGQVMAFGGQNTADAAYRAQIIGVGNELKGSATGEITIGDFTYKKYDTEYDLLDGFENKVGNSSHVSVIGTGNNVQKSDNNVIVGDYHGLNGGGNNVIIGSYKPTADDESSIGSIATQHTKDIEDTVMLGHNADVTISQGAALGAYSLANTGAGVQGFDPLTGLASTRASAAWTSTAAAVSVGNDSRKTWFGFNKSQITTFKNNHKAEMEAYGINPDLEPKELLKSLNDEQLAYVLKNVTHTTDIWESEPADTDAVVYIDQPGGGTTRQITNVAAGFRDTDAVNVAQLKTSAAHYYSVNDGGTVFDNYKNDGAVGDFSLAAGIKAKAEGLLSTVVGTDAKAIDPMAAVIKDIKKASEIQSHASGNVGTMMAMVNPVLQKMPSVTSAGSTVIGSLNSIDINQATVNAANNLKDALNGTNGRNMATRGIQFLRDAKLFDGVGNTLVGTLNRTENTNVALIYGIGNEITDSYENFESGFDSSALNLTDNQISTLINNLLNGSFLERLAAGAQLTNIFSQVNNMPNATALQTAIENNDFNEMKRILSNYIATNGGKGGRSIAIGTNNKIQNATQAIALGTNNTVTGDKSIAVGTGHTISGANSGAFGDPSTISGNNSYAIGNNNTIAVNDAFVLGNDAQATVDNVVALGNKSIAGAAATVNGYDPVTGTAHVLASDEVNNLQIESIWKATAGTVSVGGGTTKRTNANGDYLDANGRVVTNVNRAADVTVTRQITNVAAGSELTDAVNVAQLMAAQVEIVGGDNVEVIKENSNGHIKYTIHSLNAMVEAGENITVTAETPDTTEETNGKTTDLTAEGDGTTGGSGSAGETGGTTAEPTASDEPITPSDANNHTTTYTIDAKDTRNTVKAGDNITVDEKKNDDGSSTYTISAQAATNVKVIDGENTTVTEGKDGDFTTYAVNVKTDGEVAPGNTGIVTGDTVYKETRVEKDGNYIKKDNTAAENITALDEKVKDNSTRIDNINNEFNNMDNRMKKGLAGAAALAALHPLDFDPDDKWEFSAGVGNYRGETAAAIGAFYHPNDDTIFSLGATVGNGENMVNGGVTFRFGQKNHQSRSKKAMAKEIVELRAEVAELKAMVYSMANGKMPGLDLTRTEEFPDTPENHWAYDYVSVLAGNGVLEGYPDGYFKGERTLTRYEMAAIIYRAMMKGVDVDKRMAEEFAPELARVKVDTLTSHNDGTPSIQRVRVIEGRE